MQKKRLLIVCFILIMLVSPVLTMSVASDSHDPPTWNADWSYRQEIILPIKTNDQLAQFQPIDLQIEFTNPCWGRDTKEHSIRVCSWDGNKWFELESQIYDLEFKDPSHIEKCGLVFLVPEIANGDERYFIHYDESEKSAPGYTNHLEVIDDYYYYEPISGIALEGDYYQINEDGFAVYVIGQKGTMINRKLSQAVLTMKSGTKKFDLLNIEVLTALPFGYNIGKEDEDQVASDSRLISKDIRIDGNLMIEFGIVSESGGQELRTTNIYRYYYCPTEHKRLCVHVKHEVLKDVIVKGQENVDGTFGVLALLKSRSSSIKRMRFGEILPYLHFYGENNLIREYNMNPNPECKERDWFVPLEDDCDLGETPWISVDEGETGKAHGILFSSNEDIIKYGKDERDGIQVKAAEKEYLDVLGTEIDYSGIMFGRNSYEKGDEHDLSIPGDLVVEFDVELFTTKEGGYTDIISEGNYFRELVKLRKDGDDGSHENGQNIYTLTVFPRLTGRIFSLPIISKILGYPITEIWGELYEDNKLVSKSTLFKPLFGLPRIKFPKLSTGNYILKVCRKTGISEKKIIGLEAVEIKDDKFLPLACSWQKDIKISTKDQNNQRVEGVELNLLKNESILEWNTSKIDQDINMKVSYNLFRRYYLKACYKGFCVYHKEVPRKVKNVDINLDLYDLTIEVTDLLGFSPGVNVRPLLTSSEMDTPIDLTPEETHGGKFTFKNLMPARYKLHISYGRFSNEIYINLPEESSAKIRFSAIYDLRTALLDSKGNKIEDENIKLDITRDGKLIKESISPDEIVTLPPAKYNVNVYQDGRLIGEKTVDLNNDKHVNILTELESFIPILITGLILVFLLELAVLLLFKKISLNTFLKLLALSLVILSLFQPWWVLNAHSDNPLAEKNSEMYIVPQTMIESVTYKDKTYLELATVPEMFTDFVGTLLFIIYFGIFLLTASFVPNILLRRRYFLILISGSIIFLSLVALAFSFGMSKIAEISLGSLNGNGVLDVMMPDGATVQMQSSWGLGAGFYLCIFSALILIITGVIDFLRKKQWPKRIFKKA